jgi:hypothetical protein
MRFGIQALPPEIFAKVATAPKATKNLSTL